MHWHAFAHTGSYPPDSEAKNLNAAVRPLALNHWFRKPRSMHKGAFATADAAHKWLATELQDAHPDQERLPGVLDHHREHLSLGQDAYAGGWSRGASGIYVRCLLTCPRTGADPVSVPCPAAPPAQ